MHTTLVHALSGIRNSFTPFIYCTRASESSSTRLRQQRQRRLIYRWSELNVSTRFINAVANVIVVIDSGGSFLDATKRKN